MNTSTDNLTDRKLILLLSGASAFTDGIDPDGILSGAILTKLHLNMAESVWSAVYGFPEKETLILLGTLGANGTPQPTVIKMPLPGKKFDTVPLKPSETLLGALGPLDKVPVRLRRVLGSPGPKTAPAGRLPFREYISLVSQAVMWGVERAEKENAMKGFVRIAISFDYGRKAAGKTRADIVRMKLVNILDEGEITVEADADVYGLGGKRVTLVKNLGMLRKATVYCTVNKDGRDIPSLKAAFDLYGAIPALYSKERRKSIKKKPNG